MGEDVVAMATVEPVHADIVVVDWMSHSCCKYAKRDWTSTGHFQFRIQINIMKRKSLLLWKLI